MIVNLATHDSNKIREFENFLRQEISNEIELLHETSVGAWIIFSISIQSMMVQQQNLKKVLGYVQKEPKLAIISLQTTDIIPTPDYVGQNNSTIICKCCPNVFSCTSYYNEEKIWLPFLSYSLSEKTLVAGDIQVNCPTEYTDINFYNRTEGFRSHRYSNHAFASKSTYFYLNGSLYVGNNYDSEHNGTSLFVLDKVTTDKPTYWSLIRSPFCLHETSCKDYLNPKMPGLYKSCQQKKHFFTVLLTCLLNHCPTRNRKLVNYIKSLSSGLTSNGIYEELASELNFNDVEYFLKKEILFETNISILDALDNLLVSIHEIIENKEIFIVNNLNYCGQLIKLTCIANEETSGHYYGGTVSSALVKTKFRLMVDIGKECFDQLETNEYYKNFRLTHGYYVNLNSGQNRYRFSRNEVCNDIYKSYFDPCIKNLI